MNANVVVDRLDRLKWLREKYGSCKYRETTILWQTYNHAATHETGDELKVTVEGLSALKCTTNRSLDLNPTCCIVVPHRLLFAWRKQVLSNEASYISHINAQ